MTTSTMFHWLLFFCLGWLLSEYLTLEGNSFSTWARTYLGLPRRTAGWRGRELKPGGFSLDRLWHWSQQLLRVRLLSTQTFNKMLSSLIYYAIIYYVHVFPVSSSNDSTFSNLICTSLTGLLPRMMLLWRNAFPRSQKELESEKSRGDAFTWRRSLEARSGAMASIHAFLQNAMVVRHPTADLINEDVLRRLAVPIEACLNLCSNIGPVVKAYPVELKALSAMLRLRLFEALSLLPPSIIEGSYTQLLRLLVRNSDSLVVILGSHKLCTLKTRVRLFMKSIL